MIEKPFLIIIAGPNGSGKSFYSSKSSDALIKDFGIKSFDFDLEYSALYQKFISIMTSQIQINLSERTKEIFEEEVNLSLKSKINFSFQSNFNDVNIDKWRELFQLAGYKTILYFLYLEDSEICKFRVNKRVLEGGHFVDVKTIELRYKLGLANLDISFDKYDEVNIIDTSDSINIKKVLKIENSQIKFFDKTIIDILDKHRLENLTQKLVDFIKFERQ